MEVVFENVSYENIANNINFKISSGVVTGIYNSSSIIDLLKMPNQIKGTIKIDNNIYKKYNDKIVAFINKEDQFFTATVLDEILFNAKIRDYKTSNIKGKINKLFEKLDLNINLLHRICHSLSNTEKYLVKVISNLIYNPQIVIFEDGLSDLDAFYRKKIEGIITDLKEANKIVIVVSNNSNILYNISDDIIIIKDKKDFICGKIDDIYTKEVEKLINNNIDVPYFSLLTYSANKEKNANLFYRKDVRDVIKDVYKSVS